MQSWLSCCSLEWGSGRDDGGVAGAVKKSAFVLAFVDARGRTRPKPGATRGRFRLFRNVFCSDIAHFNLHGKTELICGVRIAGLGGVFRGSVWKPRSGPAFHSHADFLAALQQACSPRERSTPRLVMSAQERTHCSTIFYDVYSNLMTQSADVLVSHEAPSAHPRGFTAIDELARALDVRAAFHGHHHDRRDYQSSWPNLGFEART